MSTHSLLGVKRGDKIVGCYVHFDGYPSHMGEAVCSYFLDGNDVNTLQSLIETAQLTGGMRSFYTGAWDDLSSTRDVRVTDFLSDDTAHEINETTWDDDNFGACYTYLIDAETLLLTVKGRGTQIMLSHDESYTCPVNALFNEGRGFDLTEARRLRRAGCLSSGGSTHDGDEVDAS